MVVRHLSSIVVILLLMAIGGFLVICTMSYADAMVDPSESEESAKATAAAGKGTEDSDSDTEEDTKKSDSDSDSDEDVVKENAFSTPGNGTLGDAIKSSGKKDFYTIRTENDNTYYLVIDHAGNMDNVYMLSAIDENDLKDFLEDSDGSSGSVILPEKEETQETESKVDASEGNESGKNRLSGIISLVLLIAAGITGFVLYKKVRGGNSEPEEDYAENIEGDGLETVNEDTAFLEEG